MKSNGPREIPSLWLPMLALILVPTCAAQDVVALQLTWGLERIRATLADPANVVLPISEYKLDGFEQDLITEYRTDSFRRVGVNAKISATAGVSGEYFPAFVLYDSSGAEPVALFIDGVERGRATADWDDNNQHLFFLPMRVAFKPGTVVELRALEAKGLYRTESFILLKEKPVARNRDYLIHHEEALPNGLAGATVTWITSWPVSCSVEWRAEGVAGGRVTEQAAFNNHRIAIPGLDPRRTYQFRIVAPVPGGASLESPWRTFTAAPAPASVGSVGRGQVALQTGDPLQTGWAGEWPVTSGVPFSKGALGSSENVRLRDWAGHETPLQATTLARWDDGTVKWALLDFLASAVAPRNAYTLEYGNAVQRAGSAKSLVLTEDNRQIEIVTGPLKLQVSKQRYGFPGSVWLDGNRNGRFEADEMIVSPETPGEFRLAGADGATYTSLAPPDEVALEESGPLRATIRIRGGHLGAGGHRLFAYTIRIHAFTGQPFLRIQHTFVNDSGAAEFTTIRSLALRLPLVAARGAKVETPFPEPTLRQHRSDNRVEGGVQWKDGARVATLRVRDFWQNYPKDLSVTQRGFELGLLPPLAKNEYADAAGTVDEHRLYYYLQDGQYKLRQGVSKTHEFWLAFSPAEAGAAQPLEPARLPAAPLRAAAPPEWYVGTKAFGELAPRKTEGILAEYDSAFERSFAAYLENRETNREYGMLNFGDWWGERGINWGNSEYDTQHSFLLQFARTGDWRYFRAGEEMEWHNRDVDTVHHHTDASRVGGVYQHCIGHTCDYYATSPVPGKGIANAVMKVSHTFIEGRLEYYFLTGDARSYETARITADRHDSLETKNYDFTNCRNAGWHLILTMAMYNATHERYYLNAARIIVERVLERQTPDGGWRRMLTDDHCRCLPRHHGNAGFMVGVLLTGLRHYYEETGEECVANSIVRGAHFLIDDMWMPDVDGFRYTSCPRTGKGAWSNFLLFDGIAFAHRRTGEDKLGNVLRLGTGSALKNMTGWGKGFTQYTRVAPHFIGYLASLRGE